MKENIIQSGSVQIFTCGQCGECCRNWICDKEQARLYFSEFERNWSKNKIYVLGPPENSGMLLWEWEKAKLEELPESRNYSVVPYYAIYDTLYDHPLIFAWTLIGECCPFLENDNCNIYDIRPIYCRSFPLSYSQVQKKLKAAGICKHNNIEQNIMAKFNTMEDLNISELSTDSEFYQLYLFAKRASEIPFLIAALLDRLEVNGLIHRDFSKPPEEIREMIQSQDFENLFEYLAVTGVLDEDEYRTLWDYFMRTEESIESRL
ncbi:MAG: YkgJ family cysteine cluster protein [Thermoplasmata archaeon]|nr:MAG: YkgJ family cysteine cluster protein [Thermoplasmata archaeon]